MCDNTQAQFQMSERDLTSFEVQEKPAVAEVEMGVISILMHELKQLWVKDLKKTPLMFRTHDVTEQTNHSADSGRKRKKGHVSSYLY